MGAETPGRRLKVFVAGLHQLAAKCDQVSGELAGVAASPNVDTFGWESSAATAHTSAERAAKDVGVIGTRIADRGTAYTKAGAMYTLTEDESAAQLRKLDP